jgi:CheY-like chemotaxis protein/two-component sensor histidine kinase
MGFSGFLNEPGLSPEKRNQYTNIIIQNSNQLLSIISDIINIATIEAGQEKVYEKEVNLNALMKLLYDQYSLKVTQKGVTIRYKTMFSDEDALILTDEPKLTTILSNLISNAVKFTAHGLIDFGYTLNENKLVFHVKDTGIGIPLDMYEEIFKRFRQVGADEFGPDSGGTGLGLAISKHYIELLGGKIWLTSQQGKGSVFSFTIPYKKASPAVKKQHQTIIETGAGHEEKATILVVEDDDASFLYLKELLSLLNVTVIRAINGTDAIHSCQSHQDIKMVLMDLKLPEVDGFEATRQIKTFRPDLPVLAQSAYISENDKKKAFASGCCDYISKPIDKQSFMAKIMERL